jgi:hypothetical protein
MVKDEIVVKLIAKGKPAGTFKRDGVKNVLIVWYVKNQLHHLLITLQWARPPKGYLSKGLTEAKCQELFTGWMARFVRAGVVERWKIVEMATTRCSIGEGVESMAHIPDLIGEFRKHFIKRVTDVACTTVLASISWTFRTAKKMDPSGFLGYIDRWTDLAGDAKSLTATVRASIERHRPGMLHELDWRCKELESQVHIDEPRKAQLEQELEQVFTDRIQGLEKLVEDDLVRLLSGPEGSN